MRFTKRKAVAPVLATLLMIAVAVAMSVILFMWAQGFLSNNSGAIGSQQAAQNNAAQSSISIEQVGKNANLSMSVVVRNVGAVAVSVGSYSIVGSSTNAGYASNVIKTTVYATCLTMAKGAACTQVTPILTGLKSGDHLEIKVTTTAGTFSSTGFDVP